MQVEHQYKYLTSVNTPFDLKKIPVEALPVLCDELRCFIIDELSHNPGHLASSLGTIELTVALHYVFDTPSDKLVWDVGHQAYAHKILTGRRNRFHTNRQFGGLAPFPTPFESEYDAFIAGHASTSISAALGMEVATEMLPTESTDTESLKRHVVAIIGDGAMTGGLAFEGLNNTSMTPNNLLVILNDNNMAIDPLRGGITQYLVDITTSRIYNKWRWRLYSLLVKLHIMNERKTAKMRRWSNNIKSILTNQNKNIFQGLNLRYFGPADGHNVTDLVRILAEIKDYKGPKVLHIITKKGKGYAPAENDQTTWHAPGEFNVETGQRLVPGQQPPLWQDVFGETLLQLAKRNPKIVGITPAMPSGCSMTILQREYPERVFDVGIAEGHAVTFSAGLAKEGLIPYCNIYSSFLQRAYDNIIHDVALQKLHVVFCIDRAGIVGNDGATHHGLLDLAFLRPIPNLTIAAPMTADDLRSMLSFAETFNAPIAIRYPRGRTNNAFDSLADAGQPLRLGKGRLLRAGNKVAVLSIGAIGQHAAQAIVSLSDDTNAAPADAFAHWDMRWLKPIDTDVIDYAATHFAVIVTIEDGMINGGLGSAVAEYVADKGYQVRVVRLGVHDRFVEHGSTKELYHLLGLDSEGIQQALLSVYSSL